MSFSFGRVFFFFFLKVNLKHFALNNRLNEMFAFLTSCFTHVRLAGFLFVEAAMATSGIYVFFLIPLFFILLLFFLSISYFIIGLFSWLWTLVSLLVSLTFYTSFCICEKLCAYTFPSCFQPLCVTRCSNSCKRQRQTKVHFHVHERHRGAILVTATKTKPQKNVSVLCKLGKTWYMIPVLDCRQTILQILYPIKNDQRLRMI